MKKHENYGSLDLFRIAAALLVIAIHTSPLADFSAAADFFLTRILARIAVPFFFMVTGQFVLSEYLYTSGQSRKNRRSLQSCCVTSEKTQVSAKLLRYIGKTAALYGISAALYLPLGIYAGHYRDLDALSVLRLLVFDGTFYHLWYFPACIVGVLLIWLLGKVMNIRGITVTAGILYLIGLLGDSYFGLTEKIPVVSAIYEKGFRISSYTRNGLFLAPIFLVLGAVLGHAGTDCGRRRIQKAEQDVKSSRGKCRGSESGINREKCRGSESGISREKCSVSESGRRVKLLGFAAAFSLMTAEAFFLRHFGLQRHDSMYVMLVPVMIFFYSFLLSVNARPCRTLRSIAAWVYILHPAVIVAVRLAAKVSGAAWLTENSLIHYFAVAVLSFGAAGVIAFLTGGISALQTSRGGKALAERERNAGGYGRAGAERRRLRRNRSGKQTEAAERERKTDGCDRAWIEINRAALRSNVRFLQTRLPEGCRLMPAVKANAYGHGAVQVAEELNAMGIDSFCVACAREGAELREAGIRGEILVLGYTESSQLPLLERYDLAQTVVDASYAEKLREYGRPLHVHVGVDTGMHRLGERSENLEEICGIFRTENLIIDGMFTHLSADDTLEEQDKEFTNRQIQEFYHIVGELEKQGISCPKLHLQASYGILNYPEAAGDYARVGIALYGVLSTRNDTEQWQEFLRPVLSLKARVAAVKNIDTGEAAGYGLDFRAERPMKIATLTIGYADGLPRSLSYGKGAVLIRGCRAPVVGRICMDMTLVDISNVPDVEQGDTAVIIGKSGGSEISVCELAEQAETISNEILSRMGSRLCRVVRDGVNH